MGRKAALSVLVAAFAFLALGSSASAAWTHKGKGELKENASVTLKGTLILSTSAGEVSCPTELGATLTASSSSGHVNSFTVSKPSECDLSGSLKAICGTNALTKVEKTGTWVLTADESDITLSGIDVDYSMAGCLIPSFRLKGSSTISLDKATAFSTATFSGTQTLYNSAGEESGSGELKGALSASPAGTYGVKTAATVETKWTMGGSHLSSDGELTLSGSFSFSGSGGGVSCPTTVKLALESSTVEEEEAEGEATFTVSNAAECDLSGNYKTTCGTNAVSKVQQTGTATLAATEEDFTIAGLVLDYEFEKCAITSLKVEGSPTVSLSSPESISSATFSAGALEIFNAVGEMIGTASAGGSTSASPGGTFGVSPNAGHQEETEEIAHTAMTAHEKATEEEETESTTPSEGGAFWILPTEGTIGGEEEATTIQAEAPISSTVGAVKTTFNVALDGYVWNEGEMGEGEIAEKSVGVGTVAGVPGFLDCTIEVTTLGSWSLTLTTDADEGATSENATLDIEGIQLLTHFNTGCQAAGIPATAGSEGTLTATLENGPEDDTTMTLEGGDLTLTGSGGSVPVNYESSPITVEGVQVEQE